MKAESRKARIACAISLATLCAISSQAPGASASWAAAASGSWNNAANWSPATIPNAAGDNATISIGGTYTVALNTSQTVNTLAISGAGATLSHTTGTLSAGNINISGGSYTMAGGTISGANITTSGGGTMFFANAAANVFANNTVYNGNLVIPTSGRLRLQSGSSFTGTSGTINSNAVFSYEQTGTLSGKTILIDSNGVFGIDGANQLTLASNTTVLGNSGTQFGVGFNLGGSNLLVNNGTILAQSGVLNLNPVNLTNNSFIGAGAGSRMAIRSTGSFSNAGTLQASGGGSITINNFDSFTWNNAAAGRIRVADATSTVILDGNWSNNGTMIVNQGTLSLGGTFTRGGIGTITRTDGTIDIAGFMDNSGGTLTLNATTGDYRMNGGVISGGTITTGGGGTLTFANVGGNRLANNAVLVGDLVINNAGRIRLQSGSSFTGANGTLSNSSIMSFEQNGTLSGKTFTLDNSALLAVEGGNSLTLAASSAVRGSINSSFGSSFHIGGASQVNNSGTIQATAGVFSVNPTTLVNNSVMTALAGSRLAIRTSGSFSNAGTLEATGGGSITINIFESFAWNNSAAGRIRVADANSSVFLDGNWSNNGTLILNQGTLGLGGTFTRAGIGTVARTGGTIDIFGFMDNSGGTLSLNATTGDYRMNGGFISGGTITSTGGGTMQFGNNGNNRFANNLVYVGDLILNGSGRIRLQSGSSFTGANGTFLSGSIFGFEQTATLSGKSFTIDGSSLFAIEGSNTLTLASNTTVRGGNNSLFGQTFSVGGTNGLINNGTVLSTASVFSINPGNLTNNALMSAGAGARMNFRVPGAIVNNGTIQATGGGSVTINLFESFPFTNSATGVIHVADANSTVFLGGNWSNSGTFLLNQGTLALDGTFTRGGIGTVNRTGGSIDILGFLNSAGGTFALGASTGDFRLNGGVISGGTMTFSPGGSLLLSSNGGNRFSNSFTHVGDLVMNNSRLRLQTASSFTGSATLTNNSVLSYEQTGTLNGKTIALTGSTFAVEGGFSLTLGATSSIRGSGSAGAIFSVSGNSTLINNGTIAATVPAQILTLAPNFLTNNGTLAATNGGRLQLGATTNFGALTGFLLSDGAGSLVTMPNTTYTINQPATTKNSGMIYFQGNFTKAATFDASGRFVFDYTGTSPFASIKADIISGYAGGAWNGAGINSSSAAVTPRTAVGYVESSIGIGTTGGNFAGVAVDGTAVLVRFTLAGDNNVNGIVDISDFALLAANFNQPSQWFTGDYDYNGVTNISDFALLAANFNQSLGTDLPRGANVPEPASFAFVASAAVALQRRGRRR